LYWDGVSAQAVDLGSLTENDSHVNGISAFNEIVWASNIDFVYQMATYGAADGSILSLETEIPSKPAVPW
jgi:hypothetical protein